MTWEMRRPPPLTAVELDRRVVLRRKFVGDGPLPTPDEVRETIDLEAKRLAHERWPTLSPEAIRLCEEASERVIDAVVERGSAVPEWKAFAAALDEVYNPAQ